MSTPENEIKLNGDVIPFKPKKTEANTRKTTTIAAVVAVTVTHKTEISPEDKLFEIIENTGEAEAELSERLSLSRTQTRGFIGPTHTNSPPHHRL